jgi:hypothetical protein
MYDQDLGDEDDDDDDGDNEPFDWNQWTETPEAMEEDIYLRQDVGGAAGRPRCNECFPQVN